jgi:hypothetical protein
MRSHSVRDRLRSGLAVLGVAGLLLGGVTIASEAAGSAKPLLLGKSNKAKKTTKLTTKKGVALALKSKKGPALSVNTTDLIANLNADSVDSKGLDQLEPTTYTTTLGARNQAGAATPFATQTTTLPAGIYEAHFNGFFSSGAGDFNTCLVLDLTRLIADPSNVEPIFVADEASDGDTYMEATGLATVTAGNRLVFYCEIDTASTFLVPMTFTLKKLDRTATVPGVGPTTIPKSAQPRLRGIN